MKTIYRVSFIAIFILAPFVLNAQNSDYQNFSLFSNRLLSSGSIVCNSLYSQLANSVPEYKSYFTVRTTGEFCKDNSRQAIRTLLFLTLLNL